MNNILHYLDDFLVVGAPDSSQCREDLSTLLHWMERLGFPVAEEKTVGLQHVSHSLG